MSRGLDVYLHDRFTGRLIQDDAGGLRFEYDTDYQAQVDAAPLSICMPVRPEPYGDSTVRAFFSGLLPDDLVRHRLARYLGVSERNPFALLEVIGGECAGAVTLLPEGEQPLIPTPDDIEVLDDRKLREILELLTRRPLLVGTPDVRLSLAGAQDKIAVGMFLRHWHRLAPDTGAARKALEKDLRAMATTIQEQAEKLIEALIEQDITASVFSDIRAIIQQRAARILRVL